MKRLQELLNDALNALKGVGAVEEDQKRALRFLSGDSALEAPTFEELKDLAIQRGVARFKSESAVSDFLWEITNFPQRALEAISRQGSWADERGVPVEPERPLHG